MLFDVRPYVFDQEMDVVRSDDVIEHAETKVFLRLENPSGSTGVGRTFRGSFRFLNLRGRCYVTVIG
jgi:hypothetical protein